MKSIGNCRNYFRCLLVFASSLAALWAVDRVSSMAIARAAGDATSRSGQVAVVQKNAGSVLFVLDASAYWMSQYVDQHVKEQLDRAGWQVGHCNLPDLTRKMLHQFNVVVLCRVPQSTPQTGDRTGLGTALDQKAAMLYHFIRSGGGLLLLHDESYNQVYITEDRFLKPLGARILLEGVSDPQHQWRQNNYLRYWFAWTSNITAHNAITRGVRRIWYPEGISATDFQDYTCPVVTNSAWRVLARGMPSARSYRAAAGKVPASETFRTAPPILVSRSYSAGRVVIFASHSTFTLQSGYQTIWQGIVMSRGAEKRPSNTGRMLFNALGWLAEPSLKSGKLGGFIQPPQAKIATGPQPAPAYQPNPPPPYEQQRTFTGLIGAHTALSDGQGTVAQWAAAAKAAGYNFLVFTEAFPPMTKARWELLKQECQKASSGSFLCIPGITYRDSLNNRYITFAFPQWPHSSWLTKGGHRIANTPGIYFGNGWAPLGVVDTMHNPTGPWFLKFYGAIAVDSYRFVKGQCQRVDNAKPTYLRLMGDQYNSVPIAYYDMHRPADIAAIAKAHGYADVAWASNLSGVADHAFRQNWYAQPQHAYISQGPLLKSWWIVNGSSNNGTPGNNRRPWQLHVDVRSKTPLSRVTIYDGAKIFRRFAASGHSFHRVITGLHDRQDYFVLTARDIRGRKLISPTLRTADSRQSTYMCTDMQNTLNCIVTRTRHGRWVDLGALGGYVTGWSSMSPPILEPARDLMPQGLDDIMGGWNGGVSHALYATEGTENSDVARIDIAFASGDCNMLSLDFNTMLEPGSVIVPTRLATTHADYIEFTPRIYSYNLMLVRRETTLKRLVHPSPGPAPDMQMLQLGGSDRSFPKYAYIKAAGAGTDGVLVQGVRPPGNAVIANDVPLETGGYVAIYPDFYGSGAVFPLRSQMRLPGQAWANTPLRLHLQGANITLGYQMAGQTLPAGTSFRQTLLVMRGKFGDDNGRCFQQVRRLYGLDGPPAYRVKASWGAVRGTQFTLDLGAKDGAAVASISQAPLPNDLPVCVHGLEDRWSAVRATLPSGHVPVDHPGLLKWRPVGVYKGVGYVAVNINKGSRRLFIGHPLVCNQPALFLNLTGWNRAGLRVEIHNPTAKPIHTVLEISPVLGSDSLPLVVPAESSVTKLIPWR